MLPTLTVKCTCYIFSFATSPSPHTHSTPPTHQLFVFLASVFLCYLQTCVAFSDPVYHAAAMPSGS